MSTATNNVSNKNDANSNVTHSTTPATTPSSTDLGSPINGMAGAIWNELLELVGMLVNLEQKLFGSSQDDIGMQFSFTDNAGAAQLAAGQANANATKTEGIMAIATGGFALLTTAVTLAKQFAGNTHTQMKSAQEELDHLNAINKKYFLNAEDNVGLGNAGHRIPTVAIDPNTPDGQRIQELMDSPSYFSHSNARGVDADGKPWEGENLWKIDTAKGRPENESIFRKMTLTQRKAVQANLDKQIATTQAKVTQHTDELRLMSDQFQMVNSVVSSGSTAVGSQFKSGFQVDAAAAQKASTIASNEAQQSGQVGAQMKSMIDKSADSVGSYIQQFVQLLQSSYGR